MLTLVILFPPQISTVRSEVVQLDSRLTETSSGLRRDVDQIRKEMEDVVLKEMKQQLEEVYRRVGQEEAARKLVRRREEMPGDFCTLLQCSFFSYTTLSIS